MKKVRPTFLFFISFCFYTGFVFSQGHDAVIKGRISVQNSKTLKGKTEFLDNVSVEAASANPTRSYNFGHFNLNYFNKTFGDPTVLKITYPDFQVVNTDALNTVISSDTSRRLNIYMCKPNDLAASILKLRNVSESAITKKYDLQIDRLRAEKTDQSSEILKLQEKLDEALRRSVELANKLARVNLDDALEVYRKAYFLFEQGNIDEAEKVLETIDIGKTVSKLTHKIKQGQQTVNEAKYDLANFFSSVIPLKTTIKFSRLDFEEVEKIYDEVLVNSDTLSVPINIECALFYASQMKVSKAIAVLQKSLLLVGDDPKMLAYLHYAIGSGAFNSNQHKLMLHHFQQAEFYYKFLYSINPEKYRPFLGITHCMLSLGYKLDQDEKSTNRSLDEGLVLIRQLVQQDSVRFEPLLAWAMSLNATNRDFKEVAEAVKIFRKLARSEPALFEPYLSFSLFIKSQAALFSKSNSPAMQEAKKNISQDMMEAFEIAQRQLATIKYSTPRIRSMLAGPDSILSFRELFADPEFRTNNLLFTMGVMSSLSISIFNTPDPESAIWKAAKKTMEIAMHATKDLMVQNPDRFAPRYADLAVSIGFFQVREEKFEHGFGLIEESRRLLATYYPKDTQAYELACASNRAIYFLANSLHLIAKGSFYNDISKDSLMHVYKDLRPLFEKYEGFALITPMVTILDSWYECLQRETLREAVLCRLYQETVELKAMDLDRSDHKMYAAHDRMGLEILEILYDDYKNLTDGYRLIKRYDAIIETSEEQHLADTVRSLSIRRVDVQDDLFMRTNDRELVSEIAFNSGNVAWYLIIDKQYKRARDYAVKGLEFDPTQTWIYTNLALAWLLTGDLESATRIYAEYNDKPYPAKEGKFFREVFLSDLAEIEKNNADNKNIKAAKKMIEQDRFPKEVKNGIKDLNRANQLLESFASMQNPDSMQQTIETARIMYERLILEKWFPRYFKPDIQATFISLGGCYAVLERDFSQIPPIDYPELVFEAIDTDNSQLAKLMNKTITLDYEYLSLRYDILYRLNEYLRKTQPGNEKIAEQALYLSGNMATAQIYDGKYAAALESAQTALAEHPDNGWLWSKVALALLGKGEFDTAVKVYTSWKDKPYPYSGFKTMKERFLSDLDKLERLGKKIEKADKIRLILEKN